jgi:hypothetical protein
VVNGSEAALPHRSFFAALSPSRLMHRLSLADLIVQIHVAAHVARTKLTNFHRESEVVLEIGHHRVVPDCHVQFLTAGRYFNVLFEIDRSTEPPAANDCKRGQTASQDDRLARPVSNASTPHRCDAFDAEPEWQYGLFRRFRIGRQKIYVEPVLATAKPFTSIAHSSC